MSTSGPNNRSAAAPLPGQAQMRRDDRENQASNQQNQEQPTNILQDTGTQVKNMAQGAAEIGKGAAQGAVNIAKGAAFGAANVAQGAADVIKNTFGINSPNQQDHTGSNVNSPANDDHPINPSTKNI